MVMIKSNQICVGIVAHVDAGKTTLSEAMLYSSGSIRKIGRVDNQDAFLDTDEQERARGITIFSKQARLPLEDKMITLLDTPGHVDFSAEMERTLQVLDYAILVISASDGIQGHTRTVWKLLAQYQIPVFLFVNKMDQPGADKKRLMQELKTALEDGCVDFTEAHSAGEAYQNFAESVAMCEEKTLEYFLENDRVEDEQIRHLIRTRRLFPCYFGSALKLTGVQEFLDGMAEYMDETAYPEEFGARVFKIARDEANNRLTYLKVTGGSLKVKMPFAEEKVNQIRLYSGTKYETINEAEAGMVCAVTGLSTTFPGQGLGHETGVNLPLLEPVLSYQIRFPEECSPAKMLSDLKKIEEEEPELHIVWNEKLQEIQAQLMGEVQIEVLKHLILKRLGIEVTFGAGNIVYKETIADTVEGVGHFEPLRHYAEVHLLLEPLEAGSGLEFETDCSEDMLDKNWQRLILTHLREKTHHGVLTGSEITDMRITVVAGRAHVKHTEGGDFRQATYRALRQGLMQAESVLLEPYYRFSLEVPDYAVGRAMTDVEKMYGRCDAPQTLADGMVLLTGIAPVATMRDYPREVISYTKGNGRLRVELCGYAPCHNTGEVIAQRGYDAERDLEETPDSVFCAHGAGYIVPWYEVPSHMHVPSVLDDEKQKEQESICVAKQGARRVEDWIDIDEIDAIIERTSYANRSSKNVKRKTWTKKKATPQYGVTRTYAPKEKQKEYLLVDGYNVIFAWEELNELAKINIDSARDKLLDTLCNYQGMKSCELIAVFDAYRIKGHPTEVFDYHNIHVVFTKEAETADQFIEKFAHENGRKYQVTVVTSDGLEQIIILGQGCHLISSREFEKEVARTEGQIREMIGEN